MLEYSMSTRTLCYFDRISIKQRVEKIVKTNAASTALETEESRMAMRRNQGLVDDICGGASSTEGQGRVGDVGGVLSEGKSVHNSRFEGIGVHQSWRMDLSLHAVELN